MNQIGVNVDGGVRRKRLGAQLTHEKNISRIERTIRRMMQLKEKDKQ